MASAGVGVDIVEIDRMAAILEKTPSFARRFFSVDERALAERAARPAAVLAGRFAAHEAVLKSLGTGFGNGVGRGDVRIVEGADGRPHAELVGGALQRAEELGVVEVALSLSFTENLAVANAMALTKDVRPKAPDEAEDAQALLARSFKDLRFIVEDLERAQGAGATANLVERDSLDVVPDTPVDLEAPRGLFIEETTTEPRPNPRFILQEDDHEASA